MSLTRITVPITGQSGSKQVVISKPETKVKVTPLISLIAGGIAGGVEATITVSNCLKLVVEPRLTAI